VCATWPTATFLSGIMNMAMPESMKAEARKKIEESMKDQAPVYIKCFFPCCGGPVHTINKFQFVLPNQDAKDAVTKAVAEYQKLE